jgi:low affinity Fe/Cu permease
MHGRAYRRGSWFTRFAKVTAHAAGAPATFCVAVAIILLWAASGPFFGFSDTWQLVINTGTTIITFLMVFLIQNTQNRDSEAIQVKLDELIRSIDGAHLALLDLEDLDDKDLERICRDYRELAKQARKDLRAGKSDTDVREVGPARREQLSDKQRRGKRPEG